MATRIKWRMKGFKELRLEQGVLDDLDERAHAIARAANQSSSGYIPSSQLGKRRARASVITGNVDSMIDNAKNQTLLRSLDSGR